MKINVRLSQSKIKEIISFTLYSGNAANNGIIIDGGRYKINETCELDISNDNEVYLYVTPSGNSTNYVTINTKNIEHINTTTSNFTAHFNGGVNGGLYLEYPNYFPTTRCDCISNDHEYNFYLYIGFTN